MSDNLGLNQTRVLDPQYRNFESVIYQKKKPPLSCEVNLTGNLASIHQQDVIKFITPSGWAIVGELKNNFSENSCFIGDILASSSFTADTFKLIAKDKGIVTDNLIAMVNGWKVLVQGSNSTDENNTIILSAPPTSGTRIDFVFLEVWRKLLTITDTIYKYGNITYLGTNYTNDLVDPAIGIETSLRIQTQFRIRVVSDIDIESYPDGFDPNKVFVQGPLSNPIDTCSHAFFSRVSGDIGLWRAGAGDSAAQEDLETVDGYTYAIPMFAVHRRNTTAYDPDYYSNGSNRTLAQYLTGEASDRPDNRYNNWIVSDDIFDMRNKISSDTNMLNLCNSSFQKLIRGNLRGKLEKITVGEDHFGTIILQADAVSYHDHAGSTRIASGDGYRRIFSNAELYQSETLKPKTINDKIYGTIGAAWAVGDKIEITTAGYPAGSVITSVDEVYTSQTGATSEIYIDGTGTSTITLEIPPDSTLEGRSVPIVTEYTIKFPSGPNGLTRLPKAFLEFRKEDSTVSIASQDADIRVRTSSAVIANDGTHYNMLSNKGGNINEAYNFGHQMTYYALGNGTAVVSIPRNIEGYDILGIASAKIDGSNRSVSVSRTASTYTISLGDYVTINDAVELSLYTQNKFFETNKQGRAIVDTFEMSELTPLEIPTGSLKDFTLDSTNKMILAVASNNTLDGYGYAYVNNTQQILTTSNKYLPLDTTKSRITVSFATAPDASSVINVPVLMKSAIDPTEGYTALYNSVPYQGILDSSVTGNIETEGIAKTTTAGSGLITNYTFKEGLIKFTLDSTVVYGVGETRFTATAKPGYIIYSDATLSNRYIISEIAGDGEIHLSTKAKSTSYSSAYETYTIEGRDIPSFNESNIIDRLPAYLESNDSAAKNENISTVSTESNPVLDTRIISRVQDIINLPSNTVNIGVNNNISGRGRSRVTIPSENAPLCLNNLGLKFEKLDSTGVYQKTFQSYILNKDNSGELYLMVVGSEIDNTSAYRRFNESYSTDSVDIFRLPGRPIINKK